MNWIKSKIVMLPTNEESCVLKNKYIIGNQILPYSEMQKLHSEGIDAELELRGFEHQHLYFTSDEEIKEGDWVYHINSNTILQFDLDEKANHTYKKIIATTDPKLQNFHVHEGSGKYWENQPITRKSILGKPIIPQPSQDFIKEYCDAGGIDEVMVEMELRNVSSDRLKEQFDEGKFLDIVTKEFQIKINLDNTINIRKIKDSWSREELIGNQHGSLDNFLLNSTNFSQEDREIIMNAMSEYLK